ncbi:MAG: alpha/beta fold hydrolase [Phycisphaerales bacterium]|nr:alpha/beta fold hydrolase [Phycisphaerales bacterium]
MGSTGEARRIVPGVVRQRSNDLITDLIAAGDLSDTGAWAFVTRNWALMSIATTLVLLVLVPLFLLRKYVRIALNLMDDFAPPRLPDARDNPGPGDMGVAVDFDAFDGHRLSGTLLSASSIVERRGMVVFAHEFGMNRMTHVHYSRPLRAAGYDVLAFDFRGHGQSPSERDYKPRQFPSDREISDVVGAIACAGDILEQQDRPRAVGIVGLSRGGSAAILAAVGVDSVKALVVDGAFSSESVTEYLTRRWARIFAKLRIAYEAPPLAYWRFVSKWVLATAERRFRCRYPSVRRALQRMRPTPIFFIHGERDTFIPLEQAQMLYDLARKPRYLWMVPGARHNQSIYKQPEAYARRMIGFLDRHLAGRATTDDPGDESLTPLTQPIADERAGAPDPYASTARSAPIPLAARLATTTLRARPR